MFSKVGTTKDISAIKLFSSKTTVMSSIQCDFPQGRKIFSFDFP